MSREYRGSVGQVGQKEVPRPAPFEGDESAYLAVLAAAQALLEKGRVAEHQILSENDQIALDLAGSNSMRARLHQMKTDGECCSKPEDRKIIENTLIMADDAKALFSIEAVRSYVKEKISARRSPGTVTDPDQRSRLLGDTPEDILTYFLDDDMNVVYRRAWFLTSGGAQMVFEDVFHSGDSSTPEREGLALEEYASYVHGAISGIGFDLKKHWEDAQKEKQK